MAVVPQRAVLKPAEDGATLSGTLTPGKDSPRGQIGVSAVPASYYGTERIWANLAYRASEWMNVVGPISQYGNPTTAGRIFLQAPNDVFLGKATKVKELLAAEAAAPAKA